MAGVLLLLTLPLLAAAAVAVLLSSGRPVFYGHMRVGRNGKPFRCWKLRTMEPGAEQRLREEPALHRAYVRNGYKLPLDSDPRIMPLGRWLRRNYVDELPQLLNVLNGSMSLVGPRPVVEEELAEFGPHVDELLSIRPGIFGAWTSMGRRRPGYPERSRIELEYVRTRTVSRDLRLMARSLPVILRGSPDAEAAGEPGGAGASLNGAGTTAGGSADARSLRRLLLNSISLLVAYALPRLVTVAAVVVAARVVGPAAFGAYGTAAAVAVISSILATLGMMQLLVRDLAQRPDDAPELVGAAHVVKTATGLVMLAVLLLLVVPVLHYPTPVVAAALLLGFSYAIGSFVENLGAYFQSLERMAVWMQAQALYGLVSGGLGVVLVLATRDIVWFCAAPAVGQLAALVWLLGRAPPHIRRAWTPAWPRVRRLVRTLLPFAAAFIALTAYYKIDILLVERWRGPAEAGIYAAAYKFVDVAQALALVLAAALYPRLARLATRSGNGSGRTARAAEFVLLASVPAAALLWLTRVPVVHGLFGAEYHDAAHVVAILSAVIPILALNTIGMFVLAANGRMWPVVALYAGGLAANVGLNAVLIPGSGATGAALAMLASESALAAGMLTVVHRHLSAAPAAAAWAAALAAAAAAVGVGFLGVGALTGAVIYAVAVAALYTRARVVAADEFALLRAAVLR